MTDRLLELRDFGNTMRGEDFFGRNLFQKPPATLYHYTSLAGLLGIVSSHSIWATDVKYLNDTEEATHIWSFFHSRLKFFLSQGRHFPGINLEELVRLAGLQQAKDSYVASFSEGGDLLSQWRAYCPGGNGVCVGFNSKALWTETVTTKDSETDKTRSLFYKVKYLPTIDNDSLDSEIVRALQLPAVAGDVSNEIKLILQLLMFSTRYKHEAFAEEEEWRLSISDVQDQTALRFRTGQSMLVPYVSAKFYGRFHMHGPDEYPVKEVIIGPSANGELTKAAVRRLFSSAGCSTVHVKDSRIPYRDW